MTRARSAAPRRGPTWSARRATTSRGARRSTAIARSFAAVSNLARPNARLHGSGRGHHALEQGRAVGRSQLRLEGPVRVRHHAQHIAAIVDDAGDVPGRAVGIVDIAEDHLALALEPVEGGLVGEIVPVAIALGHGHLPLALVAGG